MSNGDPQPVSGAPYIIICSGRINVATATDEAGKIRAASDGAAQLTAFMQSYFKQFNLADCVPISTIQHELMDHVNGKVPLTPEQVEAKIKALIKEMYVLEKKYD